MLKQGAHRALSRFETETVPLTDVYFAVLRVRLFAIVERFAAIIVEAIPRLSPEERDAAASIS